MTWVTVASTILEPDKVSSEDLSRHSLEDRLDLKIRFDHLRREGSEYQAHPVDEHAESWRVAFERELTEYLKERYTYGACTVIGGSDADTITLAAFIESHKYEPKNFWYAPGIELLTTKVTVWMSLGMDAGARNGPWPFEKAKQNANWRDWSKLK